MGLVSRKGLLVWLGRKHTGWDSKGLVLVLGVAHYSLR